MGALAWDVVVASGQADQAAHEQQSEGNGRSGLLGLWEMDEVKKVPGIQKAHEVEKLLDPESREVEPEDHQ